MAKYEAYGTVIKRATVAIANVRSIGGPGLTLDTIDVSTLDGGGWRDFIASLLDGGEVTLDLVWDPDNATHGGLLTDLTSRTSQAFVIEWSDATPSTWSFNAWVTRFEPNAPTDAELSASVTLKLNGAITFA